MNSEIKVGDLKVGDLYYSAWSAGDKYINRIISINGNEIKYQGVKRIDGGSNYFNGDIMETDIDNFLECSVPLTDDLKVKFL